MLKKKFSNAIAVIASALLAFIAMGEINFFTGLIAFVPLFIVTLQSSPKQSARLGLLFGVALSAFAYSWMVSGAERFTGYNFLYGAIVFLLSSLFVGVYWGLLMFCFALLKKPAVSVAIILKNSVIAASLFCLFEFGLSFITQGFPWFSFYAGSAFTDNLYTIQLASLSGIYLLSFIAVIINYLIAVFIAKKQWKHLWIPAAVVVIVVVSGYMMYQSFTSNLLQDKAIKIAVLAENIPPDIKWDDNNGNMLVQRLLDLNKAAAAQNPDIILWSESAIPWTYRKDDDLVNEMLKEAAPSNATHVLGINSEVGDNIVNNSAYCILPNGEVAGRYDKQYLLSLIEKPLGSINIPFFSSKGFLVNSNGQYSKPVPAPSGKAGIMICNESVVPSSAANAVNNGAQFLLNMSNDGWFNNTYIVRNHFYTVRLRAVESRKDVVINCNNGYSGAIAANGDILNREKSLEAFVQLNTIHPNDDKPAAVKFPAAILYFCAVFILMVIIRNRNGKQPG